ncbi:polysaccharide deacetylase [Saccharobesus litoralis]|uniref:Polysaccharide deacetylase n=1 Tax=Saccharobesus litoralis TaxID=2172099 RepID=A0A2S0VS24_9ALTE|nr:polysaccharide deacetylase family protein [Saccharobesus litoralis]AWB66993.1 polysaccharide deacetylase [Saccharobesus litoralis]
MFILSLMRQSLRFCFLSLALLTYSVSCFAQQHAVILQYHHVAENTPPVTSISPTGFSQHMQYLADEGYQVLALPDIVQRIKSNQALPEKAVAITFDDGYANLMEHAIPELIQRGWPYTIFINPGLVGKTIYMDWPQIKNVAKQGATIANHGWQHDYWVRPEQGMSQQAWRDKVEQQILTAEQEIAKQTGQRHKMVAYPYGEYDLSLANWLEEQGFIAFGQHSGPMSRYSHWQSLPRFPANGIYANLNTLKTKLASLPFPVKATRYIEPVVKQPFKPVLDIEFEQVQDFSLQQINCFVAGQDKPKVTIVNTKHIQVQASQSLTEGRHRYNCTAPSRAKPGQYYWFSQPWLRVP